MVNYLEHYGLRRFKSNDGILESISYMHSWNAMSSPVGFRVQRHSDHHVHKFRPYQALRKFNRAPYLPFEYIVMIQIALIPPMWFYLVDPIVKSIEDAKNGIYNPDRWNREQPMSENDKSRIKRVYWFLFVLFSAFTYCLTV
jgi:hypothetical protein